MTVNTINRHFKVQFSQEEMETLNNAYELLFDLLDYVDENSVALAEGGYLRWTWEDISLMTDFLLDIHNKTLIITED